MIWRALRNLLRWRPVEQAIAGEEICRRFLFSNSDRNASMVKHGAFAPSPRTFNTSVFLISRFDSQEAFGVLRETVVKKRGQPLKGEAEFSARDIDLVRQELDDIFKCSLKLVLDESEHKHHANIDDWPQLKEQRLLIQKALASKAVLVKN
ncbi:MAG: hypothetical protein GYB30_03320 [Gammaproteobacteria bacterium]|nr:hypothetical protein [Gammaproteobacteria bacterium]